MSYQRELFSDILSIYVENMGEGGILSLIFQFLIHGTENKDMYTFCNLDEKTIWIMHYLSFAAAKNKLLSPKFVS